MTSIRNVRTCSQCGGKFQVAEFGRGALSFTRRHVVPRSDAAPGPAWTRPKCQGTPLKETR